MDRITIVTAFFDIGRGNLPKEVRGRVLPHYQHRTTDTYLEYFDNLAKIDNDMVIYTSNDLVNKIKSIRDKYKKGDRTKVVGLDSYLPYGFRDIKERIENIMNDPKYYGNVINPHLIEYWFTDYVLINILKSWYVTEAISNGLVKTKLAAWIDFGYCRNSDTISKNEWRYPFDINKITMFKLREIDKHRPIEDIIYTGDVYIMGGHIVAGFNMWTRLWYLVLKSLYTLLNRDLIDDDQTLLLMSYILDPSSFNILEGNPSDWFRIFKDYNEDNSI